MRAFKHIACIINPYAGGKSDIPASAQKCLDSLVENYESCTILTTQRDGREYACVQEIIPLNPDCCIIFGGDGTVHKVINAWMALAPDKIPTMAIYPSGSGNDFNRVLKMSRNPVAFMNAFANAQTKQIDLGHVYMEETGKEHWFFNSIGMGLDSEVVKHVNAMETHNSLSYLKSVWKALKNYKFPIMDINWASMSGEANKIHEKGIFAMVSNGSHAGGGMHFAPRAEVDDGEFDLVFVKKAAKWLIILHLPFLYLGMHIHSPFVMYHNSKNVTFNCPEAFLQADGELLGTAQCKIQVDDRKLRFITA